MCGVGSATYRTELVFNLLVVAGDFVACFCEQFGECLALFEGEVQFNGFYLIPKQGWVFLRHSLCVLFVNKKVINVIHFFAFCVLTFVDKNCEAVAVIDVDSKVVCLTIQILLRDCHLAHFVFPAPT